MSCGQAQLGHVACFLNRQLGSLARGELEKFTEHRSIDSFSQPRLERQLSATATKQPVEGRNAGVDTARFDSGYRRLCDTAPISELALRETGLPSCVPEGSSCVH